LLAALAGAYAGYGAGSWLQLDAQLTDVLTLAAGALAAWTFLRLVRRADMTETILGSLSMTVCRSSETPGMCKGAASGPAYFN